MSAASEHGAAASPAPRPAAPRHWLLLLLTLLGLAAWTAGPFLLAGTVRWPAGWLYAGTVVVVMLAHRLYVRRHNPRLSERRRGVGSGTPRWDLVWNALFWPLLMAAPLAAGLAARLGEAPLPWAVAPVGVAVYAFGMATSARAMAVNPFFEGTVRLQTDAGQRVIDVGPYRFVRHPGYLGLALWGLASPLLLRSAVAIVPGVVVALWVVLRTGLEDAFLRRGLPGYADYARRVRARLIPFVW